MTPDEMRTASGSSSRGSKLADVALFATLVGVIVMLIVSLMNKREVQRLSARVAQLETLAKAPRAQGSVVDKIYEVDVSTAPAKGPAAAAVTIAEFAEFQCPFCLRVTPTLKQLEERYKGKVRFVWKHLPLNVIHAHAMDAALAAEAAKNQGKFWEYHDKLFDNQGKLDRSDLKRYAHELGLDITRFEKDLDDPALKKNVEADIAEASALAVQATPTFFINGRLVQGAMPFETFSTIVEEELAKQRTRQAASN
jgi:protein-disulfide isomerase